MASDRRPTKDDSGVEGGCRVDEDRRSIVLVGTVAAGMTLEAIAGLDGFRGRRPVRLVVASGGGDVAMGFALYDAIVTRPFPVDVEAYGACQSIAVLVLAAARCRRLAAECRLLLHDGTVSVSETTPLGLRAMAAETRREHRRYCDLIAARAGLDPNRVVRWCARETYLSAARAVTLGLADEVIGARTFRRK